MVIGVVFMASALMLGMLFAQKDKTLMDDVQSELTQPAAVQPSPIQGLDLGTPVTQPAPEAAPVVEAPVVKAPVVEGPVVEGPVVEAPVVETPVVDAPVVEAPVQPAE